MTQDKFVRRALLLIAKVVIAILYDHTSTARAKMLYTDAESECRRLEAHLEACKDWE